MENSFVFEHAVRQNTLTGYKKEVRPKTVDTSVRSEALKPAKAADKSPVKVVGSESPAAFNASCNGKNITLHISGERMGAISFSKPEPYSRSAEELRAATLDVKRQSPFASIDLDALSEAYSFKPFKYQKENVYKILNSDSKSVFADQVGLGKSIEALMLAHALFESGIRNALLVVPKHTLPGWLGEINTKFKGVFDVVYIEEGDGSGDRLKRTLDRMYEDRKNEKSGRLLYVVTEGMLRNNVSKISADKSALDRLERFFTRDKETVGDKGLSELIATLDGISLDLPFDVRRILEEFGYKSEIDFSKILYYPKAYYFERIISSLESLKKRYSQAYSGRVTLKRSLIGDIEDLINELKDEIEEKRREWEELKSKSSCALFFKGGQRLVDLLIVDEVHSFYSGSSGDALSDRRSAMELLSEINKRFCVLLSATPIRTQLEDIFDLIYIADSKRFGATRPQAADYFYKTVCQVDPKSKNKLADMIYDEKKRDNFFGLINNFFTRKRIKDVKNDLEGSSARPYSSFNEAEKRIIAALKDEIIEQRRITYVQYARTPECAEAEAKKDFEEWIKGTLDKNSDNTRHMHASIDYALIKTLSDPKARIYGKELSAEDKRIIHGLVNWNRRKKNGMALAIELDAETSEQINRYSGNATARSHARVAALIKVLNDRLEQMPNPPDERKAAKVCADMFMPRDRKPAEALNRYVISLSNFATVCYVSRASDGGEQVRVAVKRALEDMFTDEACASVLGERSVVIEPDNDQARIGSHNVNQIAVIGKGYQAGVNLQQYRNLVISQLDADGVRLLDATDFEQLIGRIHRTSSCYSCRIVTVLSTSMIDEKRNPGIEFLRYYYSVLSDEKGLDLFGDNTPEVAFLQPIIVDVLRKKLRESADASKLSRAVKACKLNGSNGENLENYSFSQIFELCFRYGEDMPEKAKQTVRELCAIKGLGIN